VGDDAGSYAKLHHHYRGDPLSEATACPPAVVADTLVRTVELGVTITDAAVVGDTTVVFCNLLDDGQHGAGLDRVALECGHRQRESGRISEQPEGDLRFQAALCGEP
jgi:hypothetical protein